MALIFAVLLKAHFGKSAPRHEPLMINRPGRPAAEAERSDEDRGGRGRKVAPEKVAWLYQRFA